MLKLVYGPGDTLDMKGIEFQWPDEKKENFKVVCKDCGKEIEWGEKIWLHEFLDEIKDREDYDWRVISDKTPLVSCESCHNAFLVFTEKDLAIRSIIVSIYFWKSVMISFCDIIHDGLISKFDVDLKKLDERALRKFTDLVHKEMLTLRTAINELEDLKDLEKLKEFEQLQGYLSEILKFNKDVLEPVQMHLLGELL
jgi:hypothetical protein